MDDNVAGRVKADALSFIPFFQPRTDGPLGGAFCGRHVYAIFLRCYIKPEG
jgi:hypothetical protein